MPTFNTVLYLDDVREPLAPGIHWVKSYQEFVDYIKTHDMPDLISFDHDLSLEHYSFQPDAEIVYDQYQERTGYHCALYIVEHKLPLKSWMVHSMNPVGKKNICQLLQEYCPEGTQHQLYIPFRCGV